jgi:hypothetical protein
MPNLEGAGHMLAALAPAAVFMGVVFTRVVFTRVAFTGVVSKVAALPPAA